MEKKLKEELIKRVQPFLPQIRNSNAPRPNLSVIKNNDNLKHIDDATLIKMFNLDHDSINFRLEGAMDQIELILDDMTDIAEMELINDYPEIAKIMEVLFEYKRSEKTADNVKRLYNLTRYLNLPARTFEYETPKDIMHKLSLKPKENDEFQNKLEQSFNIFLSLEENLAKRLSEEKLIQNKKYEEDLAYEKKLEMENLNEVKEENNKRNIKFHPFYIPSKPKLTPFD